MEKLQEFCVLIFVVISFLSTISVSQPLYNDDHIMFNDFHNAMKMDGLNSLIRDNENLLKETQIKLNEERKKTNPTGKAGSYTDLLQMYSRGIFPNDQTIDDICSRHPELIIKSPNACHTYYNCSGEDIELSVWVNMYEFWPSIYKHECLYPFVFSDKTLQCENYTEVDCGSRFLPTWECRYFRNLCHLGRCAPCKFYHPSCENEEDGLWPNVFNGFSSAYMICSKHRTIQSGNCPLDDKWNAKSYPYNGECTHLFAIPKEYLTFGLLPSCKGKVDGNYKYVERCDAFYKCENGSASAVKCPNNTTFDSVKQSCEVGGRCS